LVDVKWTVHDEMFQLPGVSLGHYIVGNLLRLARLRQLQSRAGEQTQAEVA